MPGKHAMLAYDILVAIGYERQMTAQWRYNQHLVERAGQLFSVKPQNCCKHEQTGLVWL